MLKLDGFNQIVKGRYGTILYNKNDIYVGQAIEKYGEYSEWEVRLFRQLILPGNHVFDIGANLGTHTLAFSRIVGPGGFVYAFEPQQIVFQTLCANMALNSVINVECLPYAVSDQKEYITLPYFDYSVQGNFGGMDIEKFEDQPGVKVKVITIDEYFENIKFLNFIKIDVEGMETKTIIGAQATIEKFRPILYVENDRIEKSMDLMLLLHDFDYDLFWHLPPLFNQNNFFGVKENIYKNIVSVNLICIPKEKDLKIAGANPVDDFNYHPLKR